MKPLYTRKLQRTLRESKRHTPGQANDMTTLLSDGLLRLQRQDLRNFTLTHLVSGLDDEVCNESEQRCGASTSLSGYTEWICTQEPRLSLGWDWQLETSMTARVVRLGLPRTNILLLDGERDPLPWNESLHVLATFIDTFDWNTPAFRAVCQRYSF
ncbi:DUF4902 domain-containing protein [Variovorax sp. RT4R15]|uniref:DUF4902 domain-containing protein n=1 Tax=Variovorax sp. RT4R15 TaxID=3443737 RepID=UPI003F473C7D